MSKRLCFKCLNGRHFKDRCPKGAFKCQVQGCAEDHNTLLHPTPRVQRDIRAGVTSVSYVQSIPHSIEENDQQTAAATGRQNEAHIVNQEGQGVGATVTAATGAGEERVCLGVLPVRVKAKGGGTVVETYALLDSGSEVTLCKEEPFNKLGPWGSILDYELQGVTGVRKVKRRVLDVVVMSMDDRVSEELLNVTSVEHVPVSVSCIPRKRDILGWSHLRDIKLSESSESDVGLIIGLKEKPTLFFSLRMQMRWR